MGPLADIRAARRDDGHKYRRIRNSYGTIHPRRHLVSHAPRREHGRKQMAWGERMRLQDGKKIPAVLIVEDEPLVRLGAVKIINSVFDERKQTVPAYLRETRRKVSIEPTILDLVFYSPKKIIFQAAIDYSLSGQKIVELNIIILKRRLQGAKYDRGRVFKRDLIYAGRWEDDPTIAISYHSEGYAKFSCVITCLPDSIAH